MIIAIDGPSASGKSTTARLVASNLKFVHIDTGAMYRAVTLFLLENKIPLDDEILIQSGLEKLTLQFDKNGCLYLNGRDVSTEIRDNRITINVSQVSAHRIVRNKLVELQRSMSNGQNVVMEGRDIGTQVFPNAEVKIFIVADVKVRAERRFWELRDKGIDCSLSSVETDLLQRDKYDSTRTHSPLIKAQDAVEIDTTDLSIDQQVSKIVKIAQDKMM